VQGQTIVEKKKGLRSKKWGKVSEKREISKGKQTYQVVWGVMRSINESRRSRRAINRVGVRRENVRSKGSLSERGGGIWERGHKGSGEALIVIPIQTLLSSEIEGDSSGKKLWGIRKGCPKESERKRPTAPRTSIGTLYHQKKKKKFQGGGNEKETTGGEATRAGGGHEAEPPKRVRSSIQQSGDATRNHRKNSSSSGGRDLVGGGREGGQKERIGDEAPTFAIDLCLASGPKSCRRWQKTSDVILQKRVCQKERKARKKKFPGV